MDNSFNCVICLKELNIKDGVLTPCKHRYHSECFFKWIYKKRTCPLCRTELIAPSEDEEFLDELRRQIDWESSIYSTLRNNTTAGCNTAVGSLALYQQSFNNRNEEW